MLRDERGLVYAEYLVVTVAVSLPMALAFVHVARALLDLYAFQQAVLRLPIP